MTTSTKTVIAAGDRDDASTGAEDRGSAAAEITLITPLLILLLVFIAVLVHRGVDARLRLDDATHQAARAASLARNPAAAQTAARTAASAALTSAGINCPSFDITVDTSDFRAGGVVTVTLTCHVDLTDAALLGAGTGRTLTATASSPIDTYRATTTTAAGTHSPTHTALTSEVTT